MRTPTEPPGCFCRRSARCRPPIASSGREYGTISTGIGQRSTGSGKSGGYRTIYVFGGAQMPVFLVTVFAKNEKDNLSKAEQSELVALSKALIAHYGERQ